MDKQLFGIFYGAGMVNGHSDFFTLLREVGDPSGLKGFAYFLLCALLPWNFFSLITNLGMGAISANSGLVRRVAVPREVLVFSNVLHACVQFSIEMGLLAIVLLIAGSPFLPWLPVVILVNDGAAAKHKS